MTEQPKHTAGDIIGGVECFDCGDWTAEHVYYDSETYCPPCGNYRKTMDASPYLEDVDPLTVRPRWNRFTK